MGCVVHFLHDNEMTLQAGYLEHLLQVSSEHVTEHFPKGHVTGHFRKGTCDVKMT